MSAEHASKETKSPKAQPKANATVETEEQFIAGQESELNLSPENILRLQRMVGNRELQRMMAKPEAAQAASPKIIQRYQAGDEGHGGIEKRALTSVGFSSQEAGQIYFGNWLRDFSQLNGSGDPMAKNDLMSLFTVIRILGWGEYNREVEPQELGTYVPSEHLDNPDAAGLHPDVAADKRTIEDPAIQALSKYAENDPRRKPFNDAFAKLSPAQQAAYNSEEARRGEITKAASASGLPEYIERGKMHAKDKLKEAIGAGRNADGFQKMGDALHAVEDYFSHSNFVDVALWTLHNEGVAAAEPYVKSMVERMHGTNPALIAGVGPSGQPNIVTGTYSPGANDWVSRLELLKAQLHSGEFAKAFVIGLIRLGTVKLDDIATAVGASAGSAVGGGVGYVAGGVSGGLSGMSDGASSGASSGFDAGARSGYRSGYAAAGGGVAGEALGQAEGALEGAIGGISGFFSGAYHGLVGGASKGSASGSAYGSRVGESAGSAVGHGIISAAGTLMLTDAQLAMLVEGPLIKAQMAPSLFIIDQIIEHFAEKQTTESGVQAASRGLAGPTHSQIAKDAPDHPLFEVSARLAEEVDRQIGTAMQAAWAAHGAASSSSTTAPITPTAAPTGGTTATSTNANNAPPAGASGAATGATAPVVSDAEALPVTSLVDKYVSQPASDPWWRGVLLAAISSK